MQGSRDKSGDPGKGILRTKESELGRERHGSLQRCWAEDFTSGAVLANDSLRWEPKSWIQKWNGSETGCGRN